LSSTATTTAAAIVEIARAGSTSATAGVPATATATTARRDGAGRAASRKAVNLPERLASGAAAITAPIAMPILPGPRHGTSVATVTTAFGCATSATAATSGNGVGRLARVIEDGTATPSCPAVMVSRALVAAVAGTHGLVAIAAYPDIQLLTRLERSGRAHRERRLHHAREAARAAVIGIAAMRSVHSHLQLCDPLRHGERLDGWIVDIVNAVE